VCAVLGKSDYYRADFRKVSGISRLFIEAVSNAVSEKHSVKNFRHHMQSFVKYFYNFIMKSNI
jgi:hypothetical protein